MMKQWLVGMKLGVGILLLAACGPARPISEIAPELVSHHDATPAQGNANGAMEDKQMTSTQETMVQPVKIDKSQFKMAGEISSDTWLNSPKLDWASLRCKVVVVDFWTFACYNC